MMTDMNTGNRNTGNRNTGHSNTGNRNTGNRNTGHSNTGNRNTGDINTGHFNTGSRNTGNWNIGDYNAGNWNTGNWNTGDNNAGNWNTGNWNAGWFNTITPDGGYFFNKWLTFDEWNAAPKPDWIYEPLPTTWVQENQMTDQEKYENPDYKTLGGYLRTNDMGEEWRKAYETATEDEIQMVRDLPNFDPDIFKDITGLDLRVGCETCDGKIVEIDGKKYKLTEV